MTLFKTKVYAVCCMKNAQIWTLFSATELEDTHWRGLGARPTPFPPHLRTRFFTVCKRSCGKVMFLHLPPSGRHPPGQTVPSGQTPPQTSPYPVHAGIHTHTVLPSACWDTHPHPLTPAATAADGTHPTGMHSCLKNQLHGDSFHLEALESPD